MLIYQSQAKSLSLKIFRVNPYFSRILVPTLLQLLCFHRPGGRGYLLNLESFKDLKLET
jgi:hypothetical protein